MLEFLFSPIGRIGRAQWWLGQLVPLAFFIALWILISHSEGGLGWLNGAAIGAICIFLVWFTFCLTVKRYHDRNKSGWWYLLQFIPIVGPIWATVELGFLAGDYSDNDFGPGPDFDIDDDIKRLQASSAPRNAMPVTAGPVLSANRATPTSQASRGGTPSFGKRI